MTAPNNTRRRLLTLAAATPLAVTAAASSPAAAPRFSPAYQAQRAILAALGAEEQRLSVIDDAAGNIDGSPEYETWQEALDAFDESLGDLVRIPCVTAVELFDKFRLIALSQCLSEVSIRQVGIQLEGYEAFALLSDIRRLAAQEAAR